MFLRDRLIEAGAKALRGHYDADRAAEAALDAMWAVPELAAALTAIIQNAQREHDLKTRHDIGDVLVSHFTGGPQDFVDP